MACRADGGAAGLFSPHAAPHADCGRALLAAAATTATTTTTTAAARAAAIAAVSARARAASGALRDGVRADRTGARSSASCGIASRADRSVS